MTKRQKIYLPFKRLISIIGSILGIFVCSALLWWWVIIVNTIVTRGHPFFAQKRCGQNGEPFYVFKFRTMKIDSNPLATSYSHDDSLNVFGFGKFLRKTSIDESIQLLNVFVGKMAFIGPRPLIDHAEDHITIEIRKQNGSIALKPGISGYAQINGRTDISPVGKANLDGYYFKNFGFILDLKIFIISVFQAFGLLKNKKKQFGEFN